MCGRPFSPPQLLIAEPRSVAHPITQFLTASQYGRCGKEPPAIFSLTISVRGLFRVHAAPWTHTLPKYDGAWIRVAWLVWHYYLPALGAGSQYWTALCHTVREDYAWKLMDVG